VTDPRIQARRVSVEREKGHRRLSVVLSVLAAAGLSAGALAILHTSLFGARTVVIAGAANTSRAEILAVSGLRKQPPLIDVNRGTVSRRLERLPWVLSASVHLEWPSTVAIAIVERIPIAATPLSKGGYAVLDSTGRVLEDELSRPVGLPLVEVAASSSRPGASVEGSSEPLLLTAARLPVSLVSRVREIFTGPEGLVLRLRSGMSVVVGDDKALSDKFVSLATVLQKVDLAGVGSIDLRVATAPVLTPLVSASNVQG
jgi:cell division protein FtsQ